MIYYLSIRSVLQKCLKLKTWRFPMYLNGAESWNDLVIREIMLWLHQQRTYCRCYVYMAWFMIREAMMLGKRINDSLLIHRIIYDDIIRMYEYDTIEFMKCVENNMSATREMAFMTSVLTMCINIVKNNRYADVYDTSDLYPHVVYLHNNGNPKKNRYYRVHTRSVV